MNPLEQPLPSTVSEKMRNSNRMVVKNLPAGITKDEVISIFDGYGPVKLVNLASFTNNSRAEVMLGNPEVAWKAYEGLQNFSYNGFSLHVEFSGAANESNKFVDKSGFFPSKFNNFPLRIMVPTPIVGAIIGKKGHTIKSLTTRCKARIDIHGKENTGFPEKIISIFGQIENRSLACKEILKILDEEDMFPNKGEAMLKMLANDSYCGRLIGKEGRSIKKVKEDTRTKIFIANTQETMAMYPDRIISIFGTIDGVSAAENALSLKLAKCLESDAKFNNHMIMPANQVNYNHNMSNFSTGDTSHLFLQQDMCQVCIPNSAVGSMIGTGGANIRQMMKAATANIYVEPKPDDVESSPSIERVVTIRGSTNSCWKACFLIFEKMKVEGFCGMGEAHLKTILRVPGICIGRLIGRSGKNIKDIQYATGAIVRIPTNNFGRSSREEEAGDESLPNAFQTDVPVEISGVFRGVQTAHLRVKSLVSQFGFRNPPRPNFPDQVTY